MNTEQKREALVALAREYDQCERCSLCSPVRRVRRNVVFGAGNPGAKIAIVGGAPGADDDRAGDPFAGTRA